MPKTTMPRNISRLCFTHFGFHTLAFSLVFHAVTPEHTFQPIPIPDAEYVVMFVERLMAREVKCHDRQTHTRQLQ